VVGGSVILKVVINLAVMIEMNNVLVIIAITAYVDVDTTIVKAILLQMIGKIVKFALEALNHMTA